MGLGEAGSTGPAGTVPNSRNRLFRRIFPGLPHVYSNGRDSFSEGEHIRFEPGTDVIR